MKQLTSSLPCASFSLWEGSRGLTWSSPFQPVPPALAQPVDESHFLHDLPRRCPHYASCREGSRELRITIPAWDPNICSEH